MYANIKYVIIPNKTTIYRKPNMMNSNKIRLFKTSLSITLLFVSILISGPACQPGGIDDLPPVANAGADQTVSPSASVNLNGSASSDPNGGALTYAWTQTAGTAVTLNNAGTATPNFIAPNVSATLTFKLTVTNSVGLTSTDSVSVTISAVAASSLFVINSTNNSLTSYLLSFGADSDIAPLTELAGTNTQFNSPTKAVVTKTGALLILNSGSNSILVYDDAAAATGNLAPNRTVSGQDTLLISPVDMVIDQANDVIFVSENIFFANVVLSFSNVSDATFTGNVKCATINNFDQNITIGALALDSAGSLYVINVTDKNIRVYANAASINGNTDPTRVITSSAFKNPVGIAVDANNNLFVLDRNDKAVLKFTNATSLKDAVTPSAVVTLAGAESPGKIIIDSQGTAYISDKTLNAILVINNIASRQGTVTPDRTITGNSTKLNGPTGIFWMEQ